MGWNSRVLEAFSRSRRKKRKHKRSTVEQMTARPGELRQVSCNITHCPVCGRGEA